MITGELMSRAACSTALIVEVEVQLNAEVDLVSTRHEKYSIRLVK